MLDEEKRKEIEEGEEKMKRDQNQKEREEKWFNWKLSYKVASGRDRSDLLRQLNTILHEASLEDEQEKDKQEKDEQYERFAKTCFYALQAKKMIIEDARNQGQDIEEECMIEDFELFYKL